MPTANATFKIASWNEEPYATEPQKLTQAKVDRTFEGDLEGESRTEYLMAYGTGDARAALAELKHVAVIKPLPLRVPVPGGFTSDDFMEVMNSFYRMRR